MDTAVVNSLLSVVIQGAEIHFKVQPQEGSSLSPDTQLTVYTTRPDTLFGATYMVVAPEHPLLSQVMNEVDEGCPLASAHVFGQLYPTCTAMCCAAISVMAQH